MNYNLKQLVNNHGLWEDFLEMIDSKIAAVHYELENADTMEKVFRAQGKIAALKRLKLLRDEENNR